MWSVEDLRRNGNGKLIALYDNTRRILHYEHYRSRNQTPSDDISAAFLWIKLLRWAHPEKNISDYPIKYEATSIPNTASIDNIHAELIRHIAYISERATNSVVFNTVCTYNQGTITSALKDKLIEENGYTELPNRPFLTMHPGHTVYLLYKVRPPTTMEQTEKRIQCVLLTNVINTDLMYKTSLCVLREYMGINGYTAEEIESLTSAYAHDNIHSLNDFVNAEEEAIQERILEQERLNQIELEKQRARMEEELKLRQERAIAERAQRVEQSINRLELSTTGNKIEGIKENIARWRREAESRFNDYKSALAEEAKKKKDLWELEMFGGDDLDKIRTFLQGMKNLVYIGNPNQDPWKLSVVLDTELMYWDDMKFKATDNDRFDNMVTQSPPWKRQLLREVLVEKTVKVLMTVGFTLDLADAKARKFGLPDISKVPTYMMQGIPNPHHQYHDCWGNNKDLIRDLITKGKIIECIVQCLTAASSINIADSTVFRSFVQNQLNEDYLDRVKFLVKDGVKMSVVDYKKAYENPAPTVLPVDVSGDMSEPVGVPTVLEMPREAEVDDEDEDNEGGYEWEDEEDDEGNEDDGEHDPF